MNYTYLFGGIVSLTFGAWLTIHQIRVFRNRQQDELGWDIKLLSGGIISLMGGIYMLTHLYS